jgi:hypothetical protein
VGCLFSELEAPGEQMCASTYPICNWFLKLNGVQSAEGF